jgi:hypothetical protein
MKGGIELHCLVVTPPLKKGDGGISPYAGEPRFRGTNGFKYYLKLIIVSV